MSGPDESIYQELCKRDLFEKTDYPYSSWRSLKRAIWSQTWFHCSACNEPVHTAHFPLNEMLESIQTRTGMGKITNWKRFAERTPGKLWDNRAVTWNQLQVT